MKEFDPDQFIFMGAIHIARKISARDSNLSQQEKRDCLHDAEAAETLCNKLGLSISKMAIKRIKDERSVTFINAEQKAALEKFSDSISHR